MQNTTWKTKYWPTLTQKKNGVVTGALDRLVDPAPNGPPVVLLMLVQNL